MALVKCSDCKKKISDRIENCPHCGCPVSFSLSQQRQVHSNSANYSANELPKIRAKKKKQKKIVLVLTSIVLLLAIACGTVFFKVILPSKNDDKAVTTNTTDTKNNSDTTDTSVEPAGDTDTPEIVASSTIAAVSAGYSHTVGLKKDGTVVAVGDNDHGRCNVSDWTDIVAISAGCWHTVGLKKDGTVVAVGMNSRGQCNVKDLIS